MLKLVETVLYYSMVSLSTNSYKPSSKSTEPPHPPYQAVGSGAQWATPSQTSHGTQQVHVLFFVILALHYDLHHAGTSHYDLLHHAGTSHYDLLHHAGTSHYDLLHHAGTSHYDLLHHAGTSHYDLLHHAGTSLWSSSCRHFTLWSSSSCRHFTLWSSSCRHFTLWSSSSCRHFTLWSSHTSSCRHFTMIFFIMPAFHTMIFITPPLHMSFIMPALHTMIFFIPSGHHSLTFFVKPALHTMIFIMPALHSVTFFITPAYILWPSSCLHFTLQSFSSHLHFTLSGSAQQNIVLTDCMNAHETQMNCDCHKICAAVVTVSGFLF